MTVMPDSLKEANQQLASLSLRYAEGEVDRVSFRQARRKLICEVLGMTVPTVPEAHDHLDLPDEDDTMPGVPSGGASMASSGGMETVSTEQPEPEPADVEAEPESASEETSEPETVMESPEQTAPVKVKVKDSTLQVTLLLLLLAFVGLGGLLWFVLR